MIIYNLSPFFQKGDLGGFIVTHCLQFDRESPNPLYESGLSID